MFAKVMEGRGGKGCDDGMPVARQPPSSCDLVDSPGRLRQQQSNPLPSQIAVNSSAQYVPLYPTAEVSAQHKAMCLVLGQRLHPC